MTVLRCDGALIADDDARCELLVPAVRLPRDFGEGAGFYVNATTSTYSSNYNMYDYVVNELPSVIEAAGLGVDAVARRSIMGHSMGEWRTVKAGHCAHLFLSHSRSHLCRTLSLNLLSGFWHCPSHSGGHGALISFLRNPGMFQSVSAFAPISNPSNWSHGG